MHPKQVMLLVNAFALAHHAYVSLDTDTESIFIYENDKVLFSPSKVTIFRVPYTDGGFYVFLNAMDIYFPPAYTPTEMKRYLEKAWNAKCTPKETQETRFLESGFDSICS